MITRPVLTVVDGRLVWRHANGRVLPYVGGGEGPLGTLDPALKEMNGEIERLDREAGEKRAAADKKRDDMLAAGKNPLMDGDAFDEMDASYRSADELRDQAAVLRKRRETVLERMGRPISGPGSGSAGGDQTLSRGERREFERIAKRFMESDAYEALKRSGALEMEGAHVNTAPAKVLERAELLRDLRQRTTVNVSDAGSVVPIDQQVWPPIVIPVRQVRLLDLISIVTTESDMVNFVQQTVRTDVATETPYGTPAPEADYEFTLKQASVKRVPQMVPATKDILADQGQLQGLLEDQLMYGVRLGLESRFLTGGGSSFTDATFQGILNASGIGTVTARDGSHSTEYDLDAIHRAITVIRLALFADPSAVGLHPTTYETVVLQKDNYGRYIYPPGQEIQTIWGLVPVVTPLFAAGTGLVGDYKTGARMWLRTGLSVSASTEHLDFFTRGMVALLAEMRAAFATIQPRAFCEVTNL